MEYIDPRQVSKFLAEKADEVELLPVPPKKLRPARPRSVISLMHRNTCDVSTQCCSIQQSSVSVQCWIKAKAST